MQIQNYKILSPLGEGGMAKVYLAEHNLLGNNTAIKLLNKEYIHNENIRNRFLAEAKSMARMSHPNIIKVVDLIDQNDTVAFVMEYVEGETLKEYIERKVKLSDEDIKSIFFQILDAVGYVHDQNLVHRDIKPSNFMIDPKGKVKLMDFGIAKNTNPNSAEYTQTGTGVQMGTPMYMSPEQITETKSVTSQSDIYSLGVVLWQMVTGEKPYDTKTLSTFQLQMKIVQEELPITNSNYDDVISKATAKKTEERFINCSQFQNKINSITSGSIIHRPSRKIESIAEEKTIIDNSHKPQQALVKIGAQTWMSKNLDVEYFKNGEIIPQAKTSEEWIRFGKKGQPAWCYFDNELQKGVKTGKLYNWYAVNDPRGLAPEGWEIASLQDWNDLNDYLGGNSISGRELKSKIGWSQNGNGRDSYNFCAIPGGYRSDDSCFNVYFLSGFWWTSSEKDSRLAQSICLSSMFDDCSDSLERKGKGMSVRCIKSSKKNENYIDNNEKQIIEKQSAHSKSVQQQNYLYQKIGVQVWMANNLDEVHFRNGDPIHHAKTSEEWRIAGEKKQPAWCYYENDSFNGKEFGVLYNWYSVNDKRGLAPKGWHIASDEEWSVLTKFLNGKAVAGKKMKSKSGWKNSSFFKSGNGTNESNFNGLPSGFRYYNGTFQDISTNSFWWTSTENNSGTAFYRSIKHLDDRLNDGFNDKKDGFAVRCIKD